MVFPGKGRGRVVTVQDLGDKCTLCVAVLMTTPVRLEKRFKEELGWRSTWEDGGRGGACVQIPEMKRVRGLNWGMTSGKRRQVWTLSGDTMESLQTSEQESAPTPCFMTINLQEWSAC